MSNLVGENPRATATYTYPNKMDTQTFEYWIPQAQHVAQNMYDYSTPELSAVPSLSTSPTSSAFDPTIHSSHVPMYSGYTHQVADDVSGYQYSYPVAMTPTDFGSADESPYCSPRQHTLDVAHSYAHAPPQPPEKQHTTSGRRRAQNRAAQRAFRERKEKHAKDLEQQLAALTEKYRSLETSHTELNAAYEKLRKTIEVLTKDDDSSAGAETLRKLLEILHGEVTTRVKKEQTDGHA